MTATTLSSRELWRWYTLLVIANELDLAFTYLGLSGGNFLEANPLMSPWLFTFWPFAMKLVPLAGLGVGLYALRHTGPHLQRRALGAVRLACALYTIVLMMHVLHVVTTLAGS